MDKPRTDNNRYGPICEILKKGRTESNHSLRTTEIITFGMGYAYLDDWDFIDMTIIPAFQYLTTSTERYQWDTRMVEGLSLHHNANFNYYSAWLLDAVFNVPEENRNPGYPEFDGVPYHPIFHDPILKRFKAMVLGGEGTDIGARARAAMAVISAMKKGAPLSDNWTGGFSQRDLDTISDILERGKRYLHCVNYPVDYAAVVNYIKDLKTKEVSNAT